LKNLQYQEMTVAHIRQPKEADHFEVMFLESARFYRLLKKNPQHLELLSLLQASKRKRHTVKVGFAAPGSDVIEDVQEHDSDASER
jgi:hypothetical protein